MLILIIIGCQEKTPGGIMKDVDKWAWDNRDSLLVAIQVRQTGDVSLCKSIKDRQVREICFDYAITYRAVATRNISLCDSISSSGSSILCRNDVQEYLVNDTIELAVKKMDETMCNNSVFTKEGQISHCLFDVRTAIAVAKGDKELCRLYVIQKEGVDFFQNNNVENTYMEPCISHFNLTSG